MRQAGRARGGCGFGHRRAARRVRVEPGNGLQLVDDVLDFTAREQTLGKPVGGDLREGKVTLPLVYALERATPDERALVETILGDRNYDTVPFRRILALLEKYQGIERVR